MKARLFMIAVCLLTGMWMPLLAEDDYRLVWSNEFNEGGSLSSDWSFEHGFVRNEELQWYQSPNAYVRNGCLVIEARKVHALNPYYQADGPDWRRNRKYIEYTSACVKTEHRREFLYGRFEVRAKIPAVTGSWPAIWLLGNRWEWPQNGEIDIMEYYIKNGQPSILANACWGSDRRWTAVWDESVTPFKHFTDRDPEWAEKFHVWRMDWDRQWIRLYLDDELLNEVDLSQTRNQGYGGNTENPFNADAEGFGHYILLNMAVGSNGGQPDDSLFPLRYYVDYVRVYQRGK